MAYGDTMVRLNRSRPAPENVVDVHGQVYELHLLPTKRCHCGGTGIVLMDDMGVGGASYGEPCPMCPLGLRRSGEFVTGQDLIPPMETKDRGVLSDNKRDVTIPRQAWVNRDGRSIGTPSYYHLVDLAALSWNNGLTVRHRYECATRTCPSRGFVTALNDRCEGCVPTRSAKVPSYRAIVAAVVAKKRGDARSLHAIALEAAEVEAAERTAEAGAADSRGDAEAAREASA